MIIRSLHGLRRISLTTTSLPAPGDAVISPGIHSSAPRPMRPVPASISRCSQTVAPARDTQDSIQSSVHASTCDLTHARIDRSTVDSTRVDAGHLLRLVLARWLRRSVPATIHIHIHIHQETLPHVPTPNDFIFANPLPPPPSPSLCCVSSHRRPCRAPLRRVDAQQPLSALVCCVTNVAQLDLRNPPWQPARRISMIHENSSSESTSTVPSAPAAPPTTRTPAPVTISDSSAQQQLRERQRQWRRRGSSGASASSHHWRGTDTRRRDLKDGQAAPTTLAADTPGHLRTMVTKPSPKSAHRRPSSPRFDDDKRPLERSNTVAATTADALGREGRQFAVANVGNRGRIYLRPSLRASSHRYQHPSLTLPITPPSTAGLETLAASRDPVLRSKSPVSPLHSPVSPGYAIDDEVSATVPPHYAKHKRAYSYSTVDETYTLRDEDAGAFKIVIERPASSGRPKTSDDQTTTPTLEVPIPSYKLGTPRWSMQGTPFLRASSCATTTDDFSMSVKESPQKELNSLLPDVILKRRHSHASPQTFLRSATPSPSEISLTQSTRAARRSILEPAMYDALTFKPECDSRAVVRYALSTGAITAATPPRLVAEITSPSFLDYDLLSDFFLTFRSFLTAADLLAMLFARLRWAVERDDEAGMVVRVRTFVAMRHWILNYFMDDFVIDYELRQTFCDTMNSFVSDMVQRPSAGVNKLKILTELKKCWRRTCALYWDGPDFASDAGYSTPIKPGGIAGSRDPSLDPSFYQDLPTEESELGPLNLHMPVYHSPDHDHQSIERPPQTPTSNPDGHDMGVAVQAHQSPCSPSSMKSENVLSCSFPKTLLTGQSADSPSAYPIPRPIYDPENVTGFTSKALAGKQPQQSYHHHQRSNSFSDSLRDERVHPSVKPAAFKEPDFLMAAPFSGRLVRGNLLPPAQAYVEQIVPGTPSSSHRSVTRLPQAVTARDTPQTGPRLKQRMENLYRALSTRHVHPTGAARDGKPLFELPGTAFVPHIISSGARGQMRIDVLGAGVAEDFKKAVQEEGGVVDGELRKDFVFEPAAQEDGVESDGELRKDFVFPTPTQPSFPDLGRDSPEPASPHLNPLLLNGASTAEHHISAITMGSQSIVIVDDTVPLEVPIMTTLDVVMNQPIEPVIPQTSSGPTPPVTPPDQAVHHSLRQLSNLSRPRAQSLDRPESLTLPLAHDPELETSDPLSRHGSAGSQKPSSSHRPASQQRIGSFLSSCRDRATEISFDATTISDRHDSFLELTKFPGPSRALRRIPGGDLRAHTNVGELNHNTPQRPRSMESITAYSDSIRGSFIHARVSMAIADLRHSTASQAQHFSLGALAELSPQKGKAKKSGSSSGEAPHGSFEAEAQKLAQLPDDEDDGGVESALLKLEGKFDARRAERSPPPIVAPSGSFGLPTFVDLDQVQERRVNRHKRLAEPEVSHVQLPLETYRPRGVEEMSESSPAVYKPSGYEPSRLPPPPESVDSYSSIPLLERGLSDTDDANPGYAVAHQEARVPDGNDDTDSERELPLQSPTEVRVQSPSVHDAFLDMDSDDESDMSSNISLQIISSADLDYNPASQLTLGTSTPEVPLHALHHPPSPPMTVAYELAPSHDPKNQQHVYKPLPPTPDVTPTVYRNLARDEQITSAEQSKGKTASAHLPFVLAFDSEVLAQQFTLIEKDALNEIDWKELIEMRWKDAAATSPRSWVEFLRSANPRGVEVIIARFNIMVKWAMSECVLTADLRERVRCIIKFIHIANHCRRLRNYATMCQLTVALTSSEMSRLSKTWKLVPAADLRTLQELETLIQPTRNFNSLRAEMEGAGAEYGCIPFVGIYTHDLLVNAQRPSQIASTLTTEPLVNFERCRTAASIVKNLLRLLEASSRYNVHPIEGITERCLWMAALSDEDIRKHAESLEL